MNTIIVPCLDKILALLGLLLGSPLLILVFIVVYFDTRSPIFAQQRVGKHKKPFTLIKFRTMRTGTVSIATHEVDVSLVTPVGKWLRRTKVDELPQLINVLMGEMSLVGPRPCLFSQKELIAFRESKGVFDVLPGITGLAQLNGIDMSTPELLAKWDQQMIEEFSISHYFKYLLLTTIGFGTGDRVQP